MATPKELGGGRDNTTVIGPSILINGKLTGDEDLTVLGRVEGELTLSKTLHVEPSGVVKADVSVKNAIISGVVVGNVNATDSVELTREGRMVGDIRSPRVIIVDGASFRGRIDMGNAEPGRPISERPARPAMRTPVVTRPSTPAARPGGVGRTPPAPPPAPRVEPKKTEGKGEQKGAPPPPPPAPPTVAAGAKRKVLVKKKGR